MNGWASDASKQLANKISPDQKNTNDPKNGGVTDTKDTGKQVENLTPNNNRTQETQKNDSKQTYDTTTDINKVISGITHDVIVGSVGALAGILGGGGNIGLDAAAGGITSLKVAPKAEKPKDQKKDTKPIDTKKTTTGEPNAPK